MRESQRFTRGKKEHYIHVVVLFILLAFCAYNIQDYKMIVVLNDEFGYWGNAALFVGMPWKTMMQHTPYYSCGYSIILCVLFILFRHTSTMYMVAIFLNAIMLFGSYLLSYRICRIQFPSNSICVSSVYSIVSVFSCSNIFYSKIAWGEVLIVFLFWGILYCAVLADKEFKYRYIIGMCVLTFLLYLTHQRAIGILIPLIVFCFILFYRNKQKAYVYIIPIIGVIATVLGQKIMSGYQLKMIEGFRVSDLNDLAISGETISNYAEKIASSISGFGLSVIGKTMVVVISTFGLGGIGLANWIAEQKNSIKSRKLNSSLSYTFVVLSAAIMIALQSVRMMNGVRKDIVVYSRYMDFVLGPLVLFGLNTFIKHVKLDRVIICLEFSIYSLMCVVIEKLSWSYTPNGFNTFCSPFFSAMSLFAEQESFSIVLCVAWIGVLFVTVLLSVRQIEKTLRIFCSFILVVNLALSYYPIKELNDLRAYRWKQSLVLKNEIEEQGNLPVYFVCNLDEDMYCGTLKYLQFVLCEESIVVVTDEDGLPCGEEFLLIVSNNDSSEYAILSEAEEVCDNGVYSLFNVERQR